MRCIYCGADIPKETGKCPYCDSEVKSDTSTEQLPETVEAQTVVNVESAQEYVEGRPQVGKIYSFESTRGTAKGFFADRVYSSVEVAEDRIYISIKPKKYNKAPAILFEDITGIDIHWKVNFMFWFFIVLSLIAATSSAYYLLLTAWFLYCGWQQKITVTQRNGVNVVMYALHKSEAEAFKEDMKKVTKIQ